MHCIDKRFLERIPVKIHAIPALKDNYIWLLQAENSARTLIIDPGDEKPLIQYLKQQQLEPAAILITHQHYDHVDGIRPFLKYCSVPVYGPKNDLIPAITHPLSGMDKLLIDSEFSPVSIIDIPGHTSGHIAYQFAENLFCGDTLFASGCGRLLGGTAEQLFDSLTKLSLLPSGTKIYCGHEYTQANLRFASVVEPNNTQIQQRIIEVAAIRKQGKMSLPSTIELELACNPFLRCDQIDVITAAQQFAGGTLSSPLQVFKALRLWKDTF